MKWISSLSQSKTLDTALEECLSALHKGLGRKKPDLVLAFVSPHFEKEYRKLHKALLERLPAQALLGCSAGGIIGADKEVENHAALSIAAAILPDVQIAPVRAQDDILPDLDAGPKAWHQMIGADPMTNPQFILLADPFSLRTENLLMGLDFAYPQSVKVGGLASGANAPGKNALFLNEHLFRDGLAGVSLTGDVHLDTLVAQGCRPIGGQMHVTACDQNILLELDNKKPLAILEEIYQGLEPRDQELMQHSLFLGIVANPSKDGEIKPGDYLIRNVMAVDAKRGILAVGALLRPGQTVQFHLRDARTSHEDLDHVLAGYAKDGASIDETGKETASKGVLLFSCLGRGSYLYKENNHDTDLFHKRVGPWPVTGFFCNGEIGPVGKTTYLHGYTSCFGIVSSKSRKD